jgi:flavin-dependent dehydrogenase
MPSSTHFDLAIIGGGPAGTSAAIAAARAGALVVLFEAKGFPRHKVCGEFVSAESLDVLGNLLHDSPEEHRLLDAPPIIDRTRLFLGNRMIESAVEPAAVSIARYDLDAALWRAAQKAGVDARANSEVSSVNGDGPFQITSGSGACTAKAVVVAAGRWSQFSADRAVPAGPKWIGVKAHFHEARPHLSTDLYFFDNGYCGVQPVASDAVNACAMVRSDRATTLSEVFALHPKLAERAEKWTPLTQPVSTAPLIYRRPQPTRGNIVFAGDAAAFIDPFVGDGISIALRSGRAAAESLKAHLSGETSLSISVASYEQAYAQQFAPLLSVATKVRSLLSLPVAARAVAFELLRLPGVMPLVIRKTRRAS